MGVLDSLKEHFKFKIFLEENILFFCCFRAVGSSEFAGAHFLVVRSLHQSASSGGEKFSSSLFRFLLHKKRYTTRTIHCIMEWRSVYTFVLSWLHGPKKDDLANSGIEGICIIKGTAQVDPRISFSLELANQKLRISSCKSTSTSEQDNSASKVSSRTKRVSYLSSEQKSDSSFKGINSAKNAVDVRCSTEGVLRIITELHHLLRCGCVSCLGSAWELIYSIYTVIQCNIQLERGPNQQKFFKRSRKGK